MCRLLNIEFAPVMPPEIAESFHPAEAEAGLFDFWQDRGLFSSRPQADRDNYCILLPPPNVTGSLHMGHAFQHTLMDALCRFQRMRGRNVLWQPGVDHAGIATQLVVSRELQRRGIKSEQLERKQFLDEIWAWKERSGATITNQMRRLGASCDWTRERFTMDEGLSKVVRQVFVRLHEQGLIYRGKRMVNWDPVLLTAVSDLEVVAEEEAGTLYYVRYPFVDDPGDGMVIATTRPETILADGVVAVAPGDPRHAGNVGRRVHVPGTERTIEIIEDEHVDAQFGSGCVKITPAHDFNDFEVMQRHPDKDIPLIILMTPQARLSDAAPERYRGLDRYEARRRIVADLDEQGLLVRREDHKYMLPRGDRSGAVVEPMLTDQWFVRTEKLASKALASVDSGRLQFVPGNWAAVYRGWLDNIHDWCISRQLIWGHRIPAWHDDEGNVFVAEDEAAARAKCGDDRPLRQDRDVLDTWFSSALWPLSTLGWPDRDDPHFRHYFPTSVLVTGFDIIFFWVARMVMMSEHLVEREPFAEVYVTGLVRDAHGNKMSKSKGNIIDPLDLVDGISIDKLVAKRTEGLMVGDKGDAIARQTRREFPEGIPAYGVDALRLTFAALASYGRDIKFDLGRIGGWRHFCNKLWNAARYVLAACRDWDGSAGERDFADCWMISRLQRSEAAIERHFAAYRFDLIAADLHRLLWSDFCDWYIEMSKVRIAAGGAGANATRATLIGTLAAILRLLHPLAPFITERLWRQVAPVAGFKEESVLEAAWPVAQPQRIDERSEGLVADLQAAVGAVRSLRSGTGVEPGRWLAGAVAGAPDAAGFASYLARLARIEPLELRQTVTGAGSPVLPAATMRIRLEMPDAAWRERLQAKAAKLAGERDAARGKLANSQFVDRAPQQVVEGLRQRLAEIEQQLAVLAQIIDSAADAAGGE